MDKYKKALEKAKKLYEQGTITESLAYIFPELKENEDECLEKIKKDIISYLLNRKIETIPESSATEKWIDWIKKQKPTSNKENEEIRQYLIRIMRQRDINVPMVQKALAWLEREGEYANFCNKIQVGDKVTRNRDGVLVNLSQLKRVAKPSDEYEGLTDFERTVADIYIGWIGKEPGWKQYIKDNADILLKIAVKKFNSVQDAPFKQKPDWSEEDERMHGRLDNLIYTAPYCDSRKEFSDWLKSIKQRIGE